ncbi:MAG: polysaccharide deacetylase family protein [Xanthobacteraceae bacterium]|nr:polysaccharide deacetylase family protein [Xanthobacteraceae bacterium]
MKRFRSAIIRFGLESLAATGAHQLLQPLTGGLGFIFMLHRIRPAPLGTFQPNRHLEITPEFLRSVLHYLRQQNFDIVTMDELRTRLDWHASGRRFVAFTADDGYRDNRDHALPVLKEFDAPITVYVASDFAAGSGRLWWIALEHIIAERDTVTLPIDGLETSIETRTLEDKQKAFSQVHDYLRSLPTDRDINEVVGAMARRAGIDDAAISRALCMNWSELREFAADPLVTIGAHSISHCNLAHETEEQARLEMSDSRERIAAELQRPVRHLAYPYGDRAAAGQREFTAARMLGFDTAVTTRPGVLFPEHAAHLTALPRLSLNGNFQNIRALSVLTSGTATALWNGFRRIDAA